MAETKEAVEAAEPVEAKRELSQVEQLAVLLTNPQVEVVTLESVPVKLRKVRAKGPGGDYLFWAVGPIAPVEEAPAEEKADARLTKSPAKKPAAKKAPAKKAKS